MAMQAAGNHRRLDESTAASWLPGSPAVEGRFTVVLADLPLNSHYFQNMPLRCEFFSFRATPSHESCVSSVPSSRDICLRASGRHRQGPPLPRRRGHVPHIGDLLLPASARSSSPTPARSSFPRRRGPPLPHRRAHVSPTDKLPPPRRRAPLRACIVPELSRRHIWLPPPRLEPSLVQPPPLRPPARTKLSHRRPALSTAPPPVYRAPREREGDSLRLLERMEDGLAGTRRQWRRTNEWRTESMAPARTETEVAWDEKKFTSQWHILKVVRIEWQILKSTRIRGHILKILKVEGEIGWMDQSIQIEPPRHCVRCDLTSGAKGKTIRLAIWRKENVKEPKKIGKWAESVVSRRIQALSPLSSCPAADQRAISGERE
ncbi:hypothetical protein [Oryza sativa Japonica Group]|uniref:Uncharacterized protein n=1 Tax=Oryza sativa subsp. japonica TaxID=39947 RepID=Q5ZBC4_ORYSJ|nr:hypothetical protein [Oryza sativa Japonica Group]BAD53123.1 hypothetical protein [Oryza sativa Japonica Group]